MYSSFGRADKRGMKRPVVLIIDDDPSTQEIVSAMFEDHGGFRIGGVGQNGFEGAMLACDLEPDLVVLDYCMPRWDGDRTAIFIREQCPGLKIIAFSAALQTCPEWADDFLDKTRIEDLVPLAEHLCAAALMR